MNDRHSISLGLLAAALAVATTPGPGLAQIGEVAGYSSPARTANPTGDFEALARTGRDFGRGGCIQACANDPDPCDPPLFKQADGRCSGN